MNQGTESEWNEALGKLGEQVAEALAPTEMRLQVEALQTRNDATLQRMARRGLAVQKIDILSVRLQILVDLMFGDMDQPNRLVYEHAVQTKFAELLTDAEQQANRSALLNGVRLDPRQQPPPQG